MLCSDSFHWLLCNVFIINVTCDEIVHIGAVKRTHSIAIVLGRKRLKRDDTRAEARFGLSAKRTSPFKLAGGGGVSSVDCWQPRCAHQR